MLNRKGQFSIIAALLVAVVLVAATVTTYSTIRYSNVQDQPQILSAVDETNLGLKEMLGFTVGYYGSVLKVTGNQTYAQQLASNYLRSGLNQIVDVRPEWGTTVNLTSMNLQTNWFSNQSFSQGNMTVNYDLNGLGISGATYSTSTRLDVVISKANQTNQAQLKITMDDGSPLLNLGKSNLQFCRFNNQSGSWELVTPTNIASYIDGTYVIDLPTGLFADSYLIQVQDTRGLMVLASSFSHYTCTLNWNRTGYGTAQNYVNVANANITGAHSNFTAQQLGPDGIYDTLTEAANGNAYQPSYPSSYNLHGSTTLSSGGLSNLTVNDGVYMSFHSYASSFSGSANLGYTTKGGSSSSLTSIRGSAFTMGASSGQAQSITAYLGYTASANNFGNTNNGGSGTTIMDNFRGQQFTTPASAVVAQSIAAYIYCATSAKNMKAAIYDASGNLVAQTQEKSVGTGTGWQTFTFATPPTLSASTQYVLVVWSASGTGSADLRYSSASGGNGRSVSLPYGNWPASASFTSSANQYSIYCNYDSTFKAQAAIYNSDGTALIASTEEKTFSTMNGWVTFNLLSQPVLSASATYVLMVETSDTSATVYYDNGATYYTATPNYPTWPTPLTSHSNRQYSIYCTYSPANSYTAQVELVGSSNAPMPWNDLLWTLDGSTSTGGVAATFQLYNTATSTYPASGDGYMTTALGAGDTTKPQMIVTNPTNYLNATGYWNIMVTAQKTTATPFDLNLDWVQYSPDDTNYAVNLQEMWLNVNASNPRQDLCIKTGAMGAEPLLVQVQQGASWQTLMTLGANCYNNISLIPYINSQNLTIRFIGSNDLNDPVADLWNIDAVWLQDEPDISFLVNQQQSTFTMEVLQNGTMRWLGQEMQLTTQALPIPPVPVKAIHINETIGGVNQEVPFQIEDWASNYQIPLGLTSNTTLFGNRQMIVFLLNSKVSSFTIWWDGGDSSTQTPNAYVNRYFTNDNTAASTLTNGNVTLLFGSFNVKSTVQGTTTSSTANFMRINQAASSYGAGLAYVIHHGIVRDIVQQEAEWNNGPANCPNLYANIIIKLPANSTFYTYQLRLMFINSAQARTITDLCPIMVTTSVVGVLSQTENGTQAGFPIVQTGAGTFGNTSSPWSAHHFTQFIANGNGAGIMFTDMGNQKLYTFDSVAGVSTGALKVTTSNSLIELLPVVLAQAQFKYAYDITWQGAVVTFDATTPIYNLYQGTTPMGLWILAEYPPAINENACS